MLVFVTDKSEKADFENLFKSLNTKHSFVSSWRKDVIHKAIQSLLKKDDSDTIYLVLDMNFILEYNEDEELFFLLDILKENQQKVSIIFYYYTHNEILISNILNILKDKENYKLIKAKNKSHLLMQFNNFIIINNLFQAHEDKKCITVALMGSCQRIGTTTQSLHSMLFLKSLGLNVGLIQVQERQDIKENPTNTKNITYISGTEFTLNNLHFYGVEDMETAKNDNSYLILDFGNFENMTEDNKKMFIEQDIKIAVLGCKKNELSSIDMTSIMKENCELKCIYSFVPEELKTPIQNAAQFNEKNIYFSNYEPDYFDFRGSASMYASILSIQLAKPIKKSTFFRKIKIKMGLIKIKKDRGGLCEKEKR